jgi:hypothetical protein
MKKNEKIIILILLVVLVIAIIIFAVNKNKKEEDNNENINTETENNVTEEFVQVLEDGTKLNTSTKLNETKQVGIYKFENIQVTEKDGQSLILADVTNTSKNETDAKIVDIKLLDKDGKEIVTIGGIISPLKSGETKQFNSSMSLDYANIYDFEIILK